jgi:hypothetical protein
MKKLSLRKNIFKKDKFYLLTIKLKIYIPSCKNQIKIFYKLAIAIKMKQMERASIFLATVLIDRKFKKLETL